MHPRLTPSNGTIAHVSLRDVVDAESYVNGTLRQIRVPVADLLRSPNGGLDSQLLKGVPFLALDADESTGFTFGQSVRDGYVGYVRSEDLQDLCPGTHRVTALSSHIYAEPKLKTRPTASIPFGAEIGATSEDQGFLRIGENEYLPARHAAPLDEIVSDFVTVLERFEGIPYLWGGNSVWGMDCSGAVQLALNASGQACPRDTDMQENTLGKWLKPDAGLRRGDLVFWRGHIAVMTSNTLLIHANAHHMAVKIEPLSVALSRIKTAGGGAVSCFKRL